MFVFLASHLPPVSIGNIGMGYTQKRGVREPARFEAHVTFAYLEVYVAWKFKDDVFVIILTTLYVIDIELAMFEIPIHARSISSIL